MTVGDVQQVIVAKTFTVSEYEARLNEQFSKGQDEALAYGERRIKSCIARISIWGRLRFLFTGRIDIYL